MKRILLLAAYGWLITIGCSKNVESKESLHRFTQAGKVGADAVRVADLPLVFTGQIYPNNLDHDSAVQSSSLITELKSELVKSGSSLQRVVRLTFYITNELQLDLLDIEIKRQFSGAMPAVTIVRTQLSNEKALLCCEAVAVSDTSVSQVTRIDVNASILPKGAKVFISGQAEKGPDPMAAIRLTLIGLTRSLTHLGLAPKDCVQLKAFIKPGLNHADIIHEIELAFNGSAPPVVFIEWIGDYPAEIEMVASGYLIPTDTESVTYWYFPWLHKSPRYSSFVRVKAGTPLIFVGQIQSDLINSSTEQLLRVFERLGSVLYYSGSSYRNLVKATYYVGDPKVRTALSDLRGVYFDPLRAPAASAIGVSAFARPGVNFGLDMVAVPASQ